FSASATICAERVPCSFSYSNCSGDTICRARPPSSSAPTIIAAIGSNSRSRNESLVHMAAFPFRCEELPFTVLRRPYLLKVRNAVQDTPRSATRILIVDDHPVVVSGCRWLFASDKSVKIDEAAYARTGHRAFTQKRPDVTVIDIKLP